MTRVHLTRLPGDRALVVDGGTSHEVALADLPSFVARREEDGPRWVWDDTARWCPPLLAAGVRVARCHDLRLSRRLLSRAPAVDPALLAGEDADLWQRLGPAAVTEPVLFGGHDATDHLRADVEDARQLAAIDASPDARRLRLLVAAESAGALAAAEMTHAGVPWSIDVHEALLTERLGPRPPRGARPRLLAECADDVRRLLGVPGLNPRLPSRAAHGAAPCRHRCRRHAGLHAAHGRPPRRPAALRYRSMAHLFSTNGWSWMDEWVRDGRFRPVYQPAGSATGRWSSNGGGALSFPVQVRSAAVADAGWVFVVADVAQLEPRVLAGMSGDRALARAARGADLYQGIVEAGAVATRQHAKLGLLGAMYGATSGESGRMVAELTRRYPRAFGLLEDAARAGERGQVVRTMLGRGSPGAGGSWDEAPEAPPTDLAALDRRRRSHGRFTRNFVVQGTGAEWALCWLADLRNRLWRLGGDGDLRSRPHLVLFLHDEVVVHAPAGLADAVAAEATEAAATAGRLLFRDLPVDFPLTVSVVRSYADAGKPGT